MNTQKQMWTRLSRRDGKTTEFKYEVKVFHLGRHVNTDHVWAENSGIALYRADYISGFLAMDIVHPGDFIREAVTYKVSHQDILVFSSSRPTAGTRAN